MTIGQSLLPEFDQEIAQTRKMLSRVPDSLQEYRPHPKSMKLMRLAAHVARLPQWGWVTMGSTELDLASTPQDPPIATAAQLLTELDKEAAAMRAALAKASDAELMVPWSLRNGAAVFFTMPRLAVIRGMVLNHMIHHRAQLSVYLRLNDIPVPGMYGPSADEM
ncbi:MAG: DinB family protein [Gemmatimonadetes bacterium]|nr:DinB family protein [Gemmatimonadota bacterium]